MGITGSSARHKDVHTSESNSLLQFETGKKLFPPEDSDVLKNRQDESSDYHQDTTSDFDFEEQIAAEVAELKSPVRKTVPTVFRWENGGCEVFIAGSFTDWKARIPMNYSNGEFTTIIELPEGDHEFKFLVDGRWIHDPNLQTSNDTFGGRNNIVSVQNTDFEVFKALDSDAQGSSNSNRSMQSSPPGSYGQLIPSHNTPMIIRDSGMHSSVPPMLPPHLLNVILNKEIMDQEDPSLMPEPEHVSLNHMYALSIKDGVMVLSSTQRFKRKFVTTLLYKPIQ